MKSMLFTDQQVQTRYPSLFDSGLRAEHFNGESPTPFTDGSMNPNIEYWQTYFGRAYFLDERLVKCALTLENGYLLEFWDSEKWYYSRPPSRKYISEKGLCVWSSDRMNLQTHIHARDDDIQIRQLKKVVDGKVKVRCVLDKKILAYFKSKLSSNTKWARWLEPQPL